jgi:hypothetical protein
MPHTKTDDYRRARHALEATARARRGGVRLEAVNSTEAPPEIGRKRQQVTPSSLALIMPKAKPRRVLMYLSVPTTVAGTEEEE